MGSPGEIPMETHRPLENAFKWVLKGLLIKLPGMDLPFPGSFMLLLVTVGNNREEAMKELSYSIENGKKVPEWSDKELLDVFIDAGKAEEYEKYSGDFGAGI